MAIGETITLAKKISSLQSRKSSSDCQIGDVLNMAFYEYEEEGVDTDSEGNPPDSQIGNATFLSRTASEIVKVFESSFISTSEAKKLSELDAVIARHPIILGFFTPLLINLIFLVFVSIPFFIFDIPGSLNDIFRRIWNFIVFIILKLFS